MALETLPSPKVGDTAMSHSSSISVHQPETQELDCRTEQRVPNWGQLDVKTTNVMFVDDEDNQGDDELLVDDHLDMFESDSDEVELVEDEQFKKDEDRQEEQEEYIASDDASPVDDHLDMFESSDEDDVQLNQEDTAALDELELELDLG